MPTSLTTTGSFTATISGKTLASATTLGGTDTFTDSFWSLYTAETRAYWYPYPNDPPSWGDVIAGTGAIGATIADPRGWGLQGAIYAYGYLFATTFNILLGSPNIISWGVLAGPSPSLTSADDYLPPVWSSNSRTGAFILTGSNVYHISGVDPIIAVFGTVVDYIADGSDPCGVGAPVSGSVDEVTVGTSIYVVLTAQVDNPGVSAAADNGVWQVTCTSNSAPSPPGIGPRTYSWARPSDWSDFLAAYVSLGVGESNSRVEVYNRTWTGSGGTPGIFTNPSSIASIWSLVSADGLTWERYDVGFPALPVYAAGQYVFGNDGTVYQCTTNGTVGPNPVSTALAPYPWTMAGYSGTSFDCGAMSVTYTTKLGVSINNDVSYNGTLVDVYMCANLTGDGVLLASGIPAYTNPAGFFRAGTEDKYVEYDFFMQGDGKQNIMDGNPVRLSSSFDIPDGSYTLTGPNGDGTFSVSGGVATGFDGAAATCIGCTIDQGFCFGNRSKEIAVRGEIVELYASPVGGGGTYLVSSASGSSIATYTNVFQFGGGGKLMIANGGTVFTSTGTLPQWPTLAQVGKVVAELNASGLGNVTVTKTGDVFTGVISSSYPFPIMSGVMRSPFRFVVHLPGGDADSYYPTKGIGFSNHGYAPGHPVNGNGTASGGYVVYNYLGNDGFSQTIPPGFGLGASTATRSLWFQVTCWISPVPSPPGNINAAGSDMAFDVFGRPTMAVDAGSGATEVAFTPDAGGTWPTHAGPSGSMPSIAVDDKSNTFIVGVNSGGSLHLHLNPNADYSSTSGLVTGAVVSGSSGLVAAEPNNGAHVLVATISGGGALNISESFDGGRTISGTLTAVETSGMDPTRGFAGRVRWIGSRPYVAYSISTSIMFASSTDGGQSWTKSTVVSGDTYTRVASWPVAGNVFVYARDSSGDWHLWSSGDLTTWTEIVSTTLPQPPTDADVAAGVWPLSGAMVISGSNVA